MSFNYINFDTTSTYPNKDSYPDNIGDGKERIEAGLRKSSTCTSGGTCIVKKFPLSTIESLEMHFRRLKTKIHPKMGKISIYTK
jgi:hypothetical protein